jgi:DnaJ-class molecular chaperone
MEREDFCPHCQGKGYIEDDLHDEPCYECEGGFTTEKKGESNDQEHNWNNIQV